MAKFPTVRLRRLREDSRVRSLVQETRVHSEQLVMPLFVRAGKQLRNPIGSMPGQEQLSPDEVLREGEVLLERGVRNVLLFGIADEKDPLASVVSR